MNITMPQIDIFLIYLEEMKTSVTNISVSQIIGESNWILFDFEHNYVLKTFDKQEEAQYFLDEINDRELHLLKQSGYSDQ